MAAFGWFVLASVVSGGPAPRVVREWTFTQPGDLRGWQPNGHLAEVRVADGVLACRAVDWDPFLTSEVFEIPARSWQRIELEVQADRPGDGQIFWTNTLQSEYAGFSPDKLTRISFAGTGEWETVRCQPFWQAEGTIIRLRLDLVDGTSYRIRAIRIVEPASAEAPTDATGWSFARGLGDWTAEQLTVRRGGPLDVRVEHPQGRLVSPPLKLTGQSHHWVVVRMRAREANGAELSWASADHNGLQSLRFPLRDDGRSHVYNLDVGGEATWSGAILQLALRPGNVAGASAVIESIALTDAPQGQPDLELLFFGAANAVNRVGLEVPLLARFMNHGAEPARGLQVSYRLPDGVRLLSERPAAAGVAEFEIPHAVRARVVATRPVDDWMTLTWRLPGGPAQSARARLRVTPSLGLPKSTVVPEPQPAATDYQIGSYYFPGWGDASRWEPIERVAPIRKPVLGWYDEALPECVDWQIKWALEHGVSFFLVDWYWAAGGRSLEHWLHQGFFNARYHERFKWAVMWANHNAPNTHSVEDWRAVTAYWLEHYLERDDYLRIDGRPAVFIWAPSNIRRDVGGSAPAAELYAMSQRMAREAGLPGIYFVSMNASGRASFAELQREGYEACTSYHGFFGAPSRAADPNYFPFSLVVDESPPGWATWREDAASGGLRYLPVADTGWDARPWHGDRSFVIHDRTVPEWERLLRAAKGYLDQHDEKLLILGPWNEWGEGSYLEPCAEWGFGMLQAIRRVFGRDPAPPPEVCPLDVGLGPYDFDLDPGPREPRWDFADGAQGWGAMMGLAELTARDGTLTARSTGTDPAFSSPTFRAQATRYRYLAVTMTLSPTPAGTDGLQIFWSTGSRPMSEATSVKIEALADGRPHTYVLPVHDQVTWRGVIRGLRLDPCSTTGVTITLDAVALLPDAPP